ncbi:C-C chemokine receptor type 6 [Gastrophryne carolinensis]
MNASNTTSDDDYLDYIDDDDDDEENIYEESFCSMQRIRRFMKILGPTAFFLIFVFGLIGNILVVVTFSYYKKSKTMTDIFLLNMAIADILFIFTLPFWAVYSYTNNWSLGDFMCKLIRSIYAINFNCSMLLLACVGIDRYVAIVQVTKSIRLRNVALSHKTLLCAVVWIIAALLSSVTFAFSENYKDNSSDLMVCEPRYPQHFVAVHLKFAVRCVEVGVGFLIPFLVMLFCYACIIKTLLQAKNSQRHKAIQVIVAVMVVFLFCQVPYNIVLFRKAIDLMVQKMDGQNMDCLAKQQTEYALNITKLLAFFHCCLNPVIYAFIGVKFRNYFMKIMQRVCIMRKSHLSRMRSSRLSSDMYASQRTSELYTSEGGSTFTA